jgi:hypothetical protein
MTMEAVATLHLYNHGTGVMPLKGCEVDGEPRECA